MTNKPLENPLPVPDNSASPDDTASGLYNGIDWMALFFHILENIQWVLISAFLFAALNGLYVRFYVTPIYQATSKIYIAGSETTISLSDIQLGSSLATDYQEAFKIWHVHEMVDERLGLDYSYSKLSSMVSVNSPSGSHILYINVQSPDRTEAKLLADTYADVAQDFISQKMESRRPQLIQVAQLPVSPISPNIRSEIIKAFLFGGLLAAVLIVTQYMLDDRIRSSDDVEKVSGLVTLGMLTKQQRKSKEVVPPRAEAPPSDERFARIIDSLPLDYAGEEAINTICSAVMFTGKNMKRLAITSHEAGNGKTFVSFHMACSMAGRGRKVLLIDADLRKASMTGQFFRIHASKGLAHLLSGQCMPQEAIYCTAVPGLSFMPAGEAIKTPLPLLTSPDFEQLMERLPAEYDLVIVDTPPVGVVIDAAEIAKRCDGSLLVLESNKQTKSSLRYMQRILEQTRTPIIGCIMNKVVMNSLSRHRYYYQHGNHYDHYYQDRKDARDNGRISSRRRDK